MSLLIQEWDRRTERRKLNSYYPDEGPLRRDLYKKHTEYFRLGATHKERLFLAANRVGKTEGVGGYELACHVTGIYPAWWDGRRFECPTKWWAAGDTSTTVRDIIQDKLLGPVGAHGTGLLPADSIIQTRPRMGIPDAVSTIYVRHATGGTSQIQLKSYQEGRESFQGTEQDGIWLDEEPPLAIYTECLLRLMTTDGIMMCTFTPLSGLSDTVLSFLPNGDIPKDHGHKAVVTATWDDVPHLSKAQKDALWQSIPPYQRDARSKGIPQLGSGAIYPVPESEIRVDPFPIPEHWPRAFALDVGWNKTAAIWGALDRDTDTVYLYHEYYKGQAEPSIHAEGIKAPGAWIPGAIDPAAGGRSQKDGDKLIDLYRNLGLSLVRADNRVESGLYTTWQLLSSGKLKIFSTCQHWFEEYRIYRRDEKGKVVKQKDHLMDATRYFVTTGRDIADTQPAAVTYTQPDTGFVF